MTSTDPLDIDYEINFSENGILYNSVSQYVWSKQSDEISYLSRIFETIDGDDLKELGKAWAHHAVSPDASIRLRKQARYFKETRKALVAWGTYLKLSQNVERFRRIDIGGAAPYVQKIWEAMESGKVGTAILDSLFTNPA